MKMFKWLLVDDSNSTNVAPIGCIYDFNITLLSLIAEDIMADITQ